MVKRLIAVAILMLVAVPAFAGYWVTDSYGRRSYVSDYEQNTSSVKM